MLSALFPEIKTVIDEYFDMRHEEPVPVTDLEKPPHSNHILQVNLRPATYQPELARVS